MDGRSQIKYIMYSRAVIGILLFFIFILLPISCKENLDKEYHRINTLRLMQIKFLLYSDDTCSGFLEATTSNDYVAIKKYADDNDLDMTPFDGDIKNILLDSWGNPWHFKWSKDYTMIIIASDGPNRRSDAYGFDDITHIIERK